jgi:glutamate synthase (NADPH/NADH) large chain
VVETGERAEVHHFATLAGYGAEAINPYLAFDTIAGMLPKLRTEEVRSKRPSRYIKASARA